MALPAKHLAFLLLIFLFSCIQIQARESKFFSKFNNFKDTKTSITVDDQNTTKANTNLEESEEVPAVQQEEEPSFTQQNSNGYGLYGHGSNQFPPTTTKSEEEYADFNSHDKASNSGNYGYKTEQFGGSDTRFMDNGHINTNIGYEAKQYGMSDTRLPENNNNGYETTKQFGMRNTRFMDNGNTNNNNGYEAKQYDLSGTSLSENVKSNEFVSGNINNNNNGYETKQYNTRYEENGNKNKYYNNDKQQGLSDTRFMENGRYFYNVNNENSYLNNYHPVTGGFQSSDSRKNGYEGNNNSMGESQYEAEDNQEEFSP